MRAEKTVTKLTRQQRKYARSITEMKNRYDKYERAMEMQKLEEEAKAAGHAEGLAKGHTAGHAEGQTVKAQEVARKMKKAGYSFSEIAKFTGLPLETIGSL
jgi:predicted transposase/invertase (TIGR01784 family)